MTTLTDLDVERERCKRSLLRFLGHVVIPDPPPAGTGQVRFILWPHILRLHEAVEAVAPGGVLPHLKSRKLGVTSYFEGRFTHKGQFLPGSMLPVVSQGEKEAQKVIADCRFIWEHLPDHLRVDLVGDNLGMLKFKGGGTIEAFPATMKAGRSYTGTEVLLDEADFHDVFEASYNALLPLIQDTGGKLFVVSTANFEKVDSPFRQLYMRLPNKLFLGYFDRPGRTQATYEAGKELSGDDARFEKENARSEEEALAPPRARAYFDVDVLTAMLEDCTPPREQGGALSVWKRPVVAGRYVLFADTAWGVTGSYNCAAVFDWQTNEQVAELHGRLHPDEMAFEVWQLHKQYNHAYMGLERAGEGQERDGESVVVVDKMVELLKQCECHGRLFYHDWESSKPDTPGWQTDRNTRPVMLGEFRESVRMRQVVIRSRAGVQEMFSFVRNEKGRAEASQGAHDDRVMTYAGAGQMRKFARFSMNTRPLVLGPSG
ncbi:MAG: hypothetical protein Q8R28_13915 [Dehalococcoidia bacterium]|nr:hypothetical protein [Dehalococcoidia bacterium]